MRDDGHDMEKLYRILIRYLPAGKPIEEIDCGFGEGSGYLLKGSASGPAASPSSEEVREYARGYEAPSGLVVHSKYPLSEKDHPARHKPYGAVVVRAVSRIPDENLFEFAMQLKKRLDEDGVLIIASLARDHRHLKGWEGTGSEPAERPAEELRLLFERVGFRFVTLHKGGPAGLGKGSYLMVMERGGASSSIDGIEAIINHDRKLTTYKIALLRALCDIAQSHGYRVRWRPDGLVEVPLGLVVEKWLFYFWPIIEEDGTGEEVVVPQKNDGERKKMVRFRKSMRALIEWYRGSGGMTAMYKDFISGSLHPQCLSLLREALREIDIAIRQGPIEYTKGTVSELQKYFGYREGEKAKRSYGSYQDMIDSLGYVLVGFDTWRDMCLIGHWISESLILRWSELTGSFAKGDGKSDIKERVVALLLRRPEVERDVADARDAYSSLPGLECTWTGRELRKESFVVDHIIPYSVTYCNELWNLVPTSKEINASKSDKLVEGVTLDLCKERIFSSWQALQGTYPKRFELEVKRSLFRPRPHAIGWEEAAFPGLKEKVENLAVLRGIPRWSPPPA